SGLNRTVRFPPQHGQNSKMPREPKRSPVRGRQCRSEDFCPGPEVTWWLLLPIAHRLLEQAPNAFDLIPSTKDCGPQRVGTRQAGPQNADYALTCPILTGF